MTMRAVAGSAAGGLVVALTIPAAAQVAGAKAMFYDPSDLGPAPVLTSGALRPIDEVRGPLLHCGIHYWFENAAGVPMTEAAARVAGGRVTLHIRSNIGAGYLSVFEI